MNSDHALAAQVRETIRARQLRSAYLPDVAFREPTWDMLLRLFARTLEGRAVSVSSLERASGVPLTTAHTRIRQLCEAGILERRDTGNRQRPIRLTAKGMESMRAYFATVNTNGAHLRAA